MSSTQLRELLQEIARVRHSISALESTFQSSFKSLTERIDLMQTELSGRLESLDSLMRDHASKTRQEHQAVLREHLQRKEEHLKLAAEHAQRRKEHESLLAEHGRRRLEFEELDRGQRTMGTRIEDEVVREEEHSEDNLATQRALRAELTDTRIAIDNLHQAAEAVLAEIRELKELLYGAIYPQPASPIGE